MTVEEFEALLDEALDFYNSIHSGGQIDAGVTGGLNAVRYDIDQNLAEMQKAQARSNLGIRADGTTGAVDSVNGKTGTVVLNGDDIYTNSQNTATIGNVLNNIANPNLLDNWYFGNPVNQRAFTSGSGSTSQGYFIDRWTRVGYTNAVIKIDNGLVLDNSAVTEGSTQAVQKLEKTLPAGEYTASILVTECAGSGALLLATATGTAIKSVTISSPGLYFLTASSANIARLYVAARPSATLRVAAVKLEFGTVQTLAHQDDADNWILNEIPDYSEQLARCQRFFYKLKMPSSYAARFFSGFAYNTDTIRFTLPLPVPMRALPALSVNNVTLTTYDGAGGSGVTATSASATGSPSEADNSFVGVTLAVPGAIVRHAYMISVQGSSIADGLEFSADL